MDAILSRLPSVSNCCYFFPLETGCSIIGYVGVIFGVIDFIATLVNIISGGSSVAIGLDVFQLIITAVVVIASACLILGVRRKSAPYMIIWIWTVLALVTINLILGILALCLLLIVQFVGCLIYVALHSYFLIVVNTHRIDVETGANVNY